VVSPPVPAGTAAGIAAAVPDPELPMVTVADLGILRQVREDGGHVTVTITPTYSGCPAHNPARVPEREKLFQRGGNGTPSSMV
jgi:ring-1,2-phenylacetyl-CoA epoxidase subunit PaaD